MLYLHVFITKYYIYYVIFLCICLLDDKLLYQDTGNVGYQPN